jgi:hypothetical protein
MLTAPDLYASIARKLTDANVRLQRHDTVELTGKIAAQSDAIVKFQNFADILGRLLFVYYGMQGAYYVVDHVNKAHDLPDHLQWLFGWIVGIDPKIAALNIGAALAAIALALTVLDIVHWARKRRLRRTAAHY